MRERVRDILTEPEERIATWGQRLREALGPQAQVLVEAIPQLALVLGPARSPRPRRWDRRRTGPASPSSWPG